MLLYSGHADLIDVEALKQLGVRHVFPMGTPLPEIVKALKKEPQR